MGLSTSGRSDKLMAAVQAAHEKDIIVNALTVRNGGRLRDMLLLQLKGGQDSA